MHNSASLFVFQWSFFLSSSLFHLVGNIEKQLRHCHFCPLVNCLVFSLQIYVFLRLRCFFFNNWDAKKLMNQPRSQGLSSLPPLIVRTETLVAAGHVTTQNLGGGKICWKGWATGFSSRPNVLEYPPTLRLWMDRWSREWPQPVSLFQRLREQSRETLGARLLMNGNSVLRHS